MHMWLSLSPITQVRLEAEELGKNQFDWPSMRAERKSKDDEGINVNSIKQKL